MSLTEKALTAMRHIEAESRADYRLQEIDPRAKVVVTLVYLAVVLSFSLTSLAGILLFGVYPIVGAALCGMGYGRLVVRSLPGLPLVMFIGAFNPWFERETMLTVGSIEISRGWVEFASITLRGMFCLQACILLVASTGFQRVCRAMSRLGVPDFFTVQLMMVYRYIFVLLEEVVRMDRARQSRGYGRESYPASMWATFVGQLLLRTMGRGERIHRAMLSRGFEGHIRLRTELEWSLKDTIFTVVWTGLFVAGRLTDVSHLLHNYL